MALAQWLLHNKLSKNTFGSERNELNWKWSYVYRPPTVKLVTKFHSLDITGVLLSLYDPIL